MSDIKFSCSVCGQNIVCDAEFIGQETDCPSCRRNITIPRGTKSGPPLIPVESTATVPRLICAFGVAVVGLTVLEIMIKGYFLLQLLMVAPLIGLILAVPSAMLSVLLIRLGLGLQRGERLAVWGFLSVASLELLTCWMALNYLFEHPIAFTSKLELALIPVAFCSILAVNAFSNWARLH